MDRYIERVRAVADVLKDAADELAELQHTNDANRLRNCELRLRRGADAEQREQAEGWAAPPAAVTGAHHASAGDGS